MKRILIIAIVLFPSLLMAGCPERDYDFNAVGDGLDNKNINWITYDVVNRSGQDRYLSVDLIGGGVIKTLVRVKTIIDKRGNKKYRCIR